MDLFVTEIRQCQEELAITITLRPSRLHHGRPVGGGIAIRSAMPKTNAVAAMTSWSRRSPRLVRRPSEANFAIVVDYRY